VIPVPLGLLLAHGEFGPIRHDMGRAALEAILGPIPGWDACRSGGFVVLKFGEVELHLEHDRLYLIFMHPSARPSGGDRFDLSDWFLDGDMPLPWVEAALTARGLPFDRRPSTLRLDSGVELCFDPDLPFETLTAIQFLRPRLR
jgi:hypothetical protein